MALNGVERDADELGFALSESITRGLVVWEWRREGRSATPCFLTEGEALSWMHHALQADVFSPSRRAPSDALTQPRLG